MIHFTLRSSTNDEIPRLLKGDVPSSPASTLGTGNWANPPRAILFGGAFTAENVRELKALVDGGDGRKIPWVAVDGSKPRPQLAGNEKGYMAAISARFKQGLGELKAEGKLDGDGADEVRFV